MIMAVRKWRLHHWILIGMALGAVLGLGLNFGATHEWLSREIVLQVAEVGKAGGDLFLRLLQMLVVPLVVSSIVTGIAKMGDVTKLGRLGGRAMLYYLGTSTLAILTGVLVVNLVSPGQGVDVSMLSGETVEHLPVTSATSASLGEVLWTQLQHMIPKNPIAAAAEGAMLPLIFFSLLLGVFLNRAEHDPDEEGPEGPQTLRRFFAGVAAVMMRMTMFVIHFAPIGVFGFMLYATAGHGLEAFAALAKYALAVTLALLVHAVVTLPLLLRWLARRSPFAYARALMPALLTAFSTASSNGTLPLSIRCVTEAGDVDEEVGAFVLPLGATINMDGTALYEVVAVLFIAQVYGLDLSMAQQMIVALTALLASVGAAGIPHAGVVMMVVVLHAVGLPAEAAGLILAVDRVLDMARTTVNVWSDATAAAVIDANR